MKILQICNKVPYPVKDGGALAIHNISKGMNEAGHQIWILAMHTKKHEVNKPEVLEYFNSLNIRIELVDMNTEISALKAFINLFFSNLPYNVTRFISKPFRKTLINTLRNNTFDIIQLEGAYLIPYIRTIRNYSTAKISFRAHNIEHEIWYRYSGEQQNRLKKFYFSVLAGRIFRFEKKALNKYDFIIPITFRDYFSFQKLGNQKPAYVCPYAYDFLKKELAGELRVSDRLFFIGSLDWMPNQEGLLWFVQKVWPSIQEKCPAAAFYIAGRNAPEGFEKYFDQPNIHYAGEVDSAEQFIKDKQILIAPLFSGSGMRVKIVEAMAMGKTVITTTIGAEGIDVMPGENIMIADKPDDFEAAVLKVLKDKALCELIGKNAARFVKEHLDNHKIIQGLINFYKIQL